MAQQKTELVTVPCYNIINEDILSEEFWLICVYVGIERL